MTTCVEHRSWQALPARDEKSSFPGQMKKKRYLEPSSIERGRLSGLLKS